MRQLFSILFIVAGSLLWLFYLRGEFIAHVTSDNTVVTIAAAFVGCGSGILGLLVYGLLFRHRDTAANADS